MCKKQIKNRPGQLSVATWHDIKCVHAINFLTHLKRMTLFRQPIGNDCWPRQNLDACPGFVCKASSSLLVSMTTFREKPACWWLCCYRDSQCAPINQQKIPTEASLLFWLLLAQFWLCGWGGSVTCKEQWERTSPGSWKRKSCTTLQRKVMYTVPMTQFSGCPCGFGLGQPLEIGEC